MTRRSRAQPSRPGSRSGHGPLDVGQRTALGVLGSIAAITAAWWALALWPLPTDAPMWLTRVREVCFNSGSNGLPDASGWLLLVGQPLGMIGLLVIGWTETVRSALRAVASRSRGRWALVAFAGLTLAGLTAAGARVLSADAPPGGAGATLEPAGSVARVDWPVPDGTLLDQNGERFALGNLGHPVFVTFAFGHCETVCPVVVHEVIAAREILDAQIRVGIVVLTLDPWRDTPSRLASIAHRWNLPADARLLGGTVEQVETSLDAWRVPRQRDLRTGDIVHPSLVYLVDAEGRVAYSTTGGVSTLVELARHLEPAPVSLAGEERPGRAEASTSGRVDGGGPLVAR